MGATLNMLIELFGDAVIAKPPVEKADFSAAALISQDPSIDSAIIYVGTEQEALNFLSIHPTVFAIAAGGEAPCGEPLPRYCASRLLILDRSTDVATAFQRTWDYLNKVLLWTLSMKTTLIEGGSYQQILDCCDDMFDEFIAVNDSSFRLLAHNGKVPPPMTPWRATSSRRGTIPTKVSPDSRRRAPSSAGKRRSESSGSTARSSLKRLA